METTCTSRHRRKTVLHRRNKNTHDNSAELNVCISNRDLLLGKPRINGEENINDNANDVLGDAEHTLYQGVLYSSKCHSVSRNTRDSNLIYGHKKNGAPSADFHETSAYRTIVFAKTSYSKFCNNVLRYDRI